MEELRSGHEEMIEALARKIPGFAGYLDRERRRDADKLQRDTVAKGTVALKARIQDVQEELLNAGDMKSMTRLGEINNRLDRVTERLRHANQGYAGFFSQNQVNLEELTAIYEFDLALFNHLEASEAALEAVRRAAEARDNVGSAASDLEKTVKELDARLDERERLLKGVS